VIFRFIYTNLISFQKITENIKNLINHGSLIITINLNFNPDLAIARERIYQNYIHECQIKIPKLAKKLATYLIQKE
jgi:hypothetical protein